VFLEGNMCGLLIVYMYKCNWKIWKNCYRKSSKICWSNLRDSI